MASHSSVCASCLRAARLAPQRKLHPSSLRSIGFQTTLRFYSAEASSSLVYSNTLLDFLAPSLQHQPAILRKRVTPQRWQIKQYSTAATNLEPAPSIPVSPQNGQNNTGSMRIIQNARLDSVTNTPMMISITPRASSRLSQIMETDSNPSLCLRVSVESGGCHGFQYLITLTDMSDVSPEEDTVFEGDKGAKIVVDEASLEVLKGAKVDYTMELIGSQFKVVDIPGATSSCGCGTSFDLKF